MGGGGGVGGGCACVADAVATWRRVVSRVRALFASVHPTLHSPAHVLTVTAHGTRYTLGTRCSGVAV